MTAQQVQPSTPTLFIHLVETMCRNGSQYHCSLLRAIELPKWLRQAGLVELRQKLADTDSPDHIFHHPDFKYRGIQTVFVGHVPE